MLRWEQDAVSRHWDGHSGSEHVATIATPAAGYAYRWYLRVDGFTRPFIEAPDFDAARAAAEAAWRGWCESAGLAPAPVWRDIATAPRDGTRVLATDGARVWMSEWGHRYGGPVTWELADFALDPTHWMPLPPLPDAAGTDAGGGMLPPYKKAAAREGARGAAEVAS